MEAAWGEKRPRRVLLGLHFTLVSKALSAVEGSRPLPVVVESMAACHR